MNQTKYAAKALSDKSTQHLPVRVKRSNRLVRRYVSLLVLLAVALPTAACFESKVITSKVTPASTANKKEMNGVFYALPRTVVKADVPVVRTNRQPGAFAVYTPCEGFFPGEDFIMKKESEFAVDARNIKFDTLFIPDTEEIYMIKTKGGMFETRNLELTLTESGVLVKASADVTNDTIDIVTGSIKTGAGLVAKALPVLLSAPVGATPEQDKCRAVSVAKWVEALKLEDRGIIDAGMNINEAELTKVKAIPELLRDRNKFNGGYDEARKIVDQLNDLLDRRASIIAEQPSATPQVATVNADSLRLVLDEIDKTVADLKATYFFGSESKITWNASFRLNPKRENLSAAGQLTPINLFTLSPAFGVCTIDVNQGVQLDPKFKITKQCKDGASTCKPKEMEEVHCVGQQVKLEMSTGENGEGGPGGSLFADKVRDAHLNQNGNRGFFYRIPGRAIAFVKREETELARAPLSIAQFGEVVSLPASTGGRKTKYTLDLFEASGGLKNFSMGSSALIQQKNIDDVAGAATTLIEAKGERNKAKAPADELQQLERQRKILEEKKKIRDLEKELNTGTPEGDSTP